MIKIKNYISFFITIIIILTICLNITKISTALRKSIILEPEIIVIPSNDYQKTEQFLLIKQVDNYNPNNFQDLLNIFYSILNQGWEEFTFYCPKEYKTCLDDIEKISYDEGVLSNINNYVHPYNSYSTIKTIYDDTGEVTIKINYLYSDDEIKMIDKDIDKIILENTTNEMSIEQKIKSLHDFIINNTKYDSNRANDLESNYDSARILGVLYDNYAICSGYTDVMAVFLEKLNVPNFKVASDTHIWNAVYINNQWKHLDLTWDDPITTSGEDVLEYSYFLVNTEDILKLDTYINEHNFDKNIYLEFK